MLQLSVLHIQELAVVLVINPAKQQRQVPRGSRQGKLKQSFQFQTDSSVRGCFPLCIKLIHSSMEFFAAALAAPYPQILFGDVTFTCNVCLLKVPMSVPAWCLCAQPAPRALHRLKMQCPPLGQTLRKRLMVGGI